MSFDIFSIELPRQTRFIVYAKKGTMSQDQRVLFSTQNFNHNTATVEPLLSQKTQTNSKAKSPNPCPNRIMLMTRMASPQDKTNDAATSSHDDDLRLSPRNQSSPSSPPTNKHGKSLLPVPNFEIKKTLISNLANLGLISKGSEQGHEGQQKGNNSDKEDNDENRNRLRAGLQAGVHQNEDCIHRKRDSFVVGDLVYNPHMTAAIHYAASSSDDDDDELDELEEIERKHRGLSTKKRHHHKASSMEKLDEDNMLLGDHSINTTSTGSKTSDLDYSGNHLICEFGRRG